MFALRAGVIQRGIAYLVFACGDVQSVILRFIAQMAAWVVLV